MHFKTFPYKSSIIPVLTLLLIFFVCSCEKDPDPPDEPVHPLTLRIVSGPPEISDSDSATFEMRCNRQSGCTFFCQLNDDDPEECSSSITYNNLSDGYHQFTATVVDENDEESEPISWEWLIDTALPKIINLEGPDRITNEVTAVFSFDCSKNNCQFFCDFNGEGFHPCQSGETYTDLSDGLHVFTVKSLDENGFSGPPEEWEWTVDTVPPVVQELTGPSSHTDNTSASFSFSCSKDDCEFTCSLSGLSAGIISSPTDCISGVSYTDLEDDEYEFSVFAVDPAGNQGLSVIWEWVIESTESITVENLSGPESPVNSTTAIFSFDCSTAECSYICELTGTNLGIISAEAPCTSPVEFTDLEDDDYTFSVSASDPAGNESPTATWSWTIDTQSPTVNILTTPENPANATTASFSFECSKQNCIFECELGGINQGIISPQAPCTSPAVFTDLEDDDYLFSVIAVDQAGNSSNAATWNWLIDTILPSVQILTGPENPSNLETASFSFECSKTDCQFTCGLTGVEQGVISDQGPCISPAEFTDLPDDEYTFSVSAVDPAGNISSESTWNWTVNTDLPSIENLTGPDDPTNITSASFSFECSKNDCVFECELEGISQGIISAEAPCTSPVEFTDLDDDDYTFSVSASDPAGNESATATWNWTIDTKVPTLSILTGPENLTNDTTASFSFECSKQDCSFECELEGTIQGIISAGAPCTSPVEFTDLDDDDYTFSVSASDPAGNESETATWNWITDTEEPQINVLSRPPNQTTDNWADFDFECTNKDDCIFECALDYDDGLGNAITGDWEPCIPVHSLEDLDAGDYMLHIRATDSAGNQEMVSLSWTISLPVEWNMVSTGGLHTCAIQNNQTLWCWGLNADGQLGLGNTAIRYSPVRVGNESDWIMIEGGFQYTCGLRDNGTLWCWGRNSNGQLGIGNTVNRSSPVQVGNDNDWIFLSSGYYHSCGIRDNGTLWCWGRNSVGQLGQGYTDNDDKTTPQQVGVETNWISVSTGDFHTCGIQDDDTLWCWGFGTRGQLGAGDVMSGTPYQVGSDWIEVSAGGSFTCGLRGNGSLWCWGKNEDGQLGLNDFIDRNTPHQVGTETDWTEFSTGFNHTCAVKDNGTLWCWGSNDEYQLGIFGGSSRNTPHQVETDTDWHLISVEYHRSCGIRDDGTLWCWGRNGEGQLGLGDSMRRRPPHQVPDP